MRLRERAALSLSSCKIMLVVLTGHGVHSSPARMLAILCNPTPKINIILDQNPDIPLPRKGGEIWQRTTLFSHSRYMLTPAQRLVA